MSEMHTKGVAEAMVEHDCDADRCGVCRGCRICECPITRRDIETEVIARLDALPGDDAEGEHGTADDILAEYVPEAVADAYHRARNRAGGWWYA